MTPTIPTQTPTKSPGAGAVSQLLCGCPYSCSNYVPSPFTCTVPTTFNYTQKTPYTCDESPQFCVLPYWSAITFTPNTVYEQQYIRLRSPTTSLYCYDSTVMWFVGSTAIQISGLTEDGSGGCVLYTNPPYQSTDFAIYLNNVVDTTTNIVLETSIQSGGVFNIDFELAGTASAFTAQSINTCCQTIPDTVDISTACSTVEFQASGSQWIATTPFDVSCATTSEIVPGGIQYWFDAQVLGYADTPCDLNPINTTTLNATQIVLSTASPTLFPTSDPAVLRLDPVASDLLIDESLCPVTVSGFARPVFATLATSNLSVEFKSGSIWDPSDLYTVQVSGLEYNLTSSACVAQTESCRSNWDAFATVQAPTPSINYVATTSTYGSDVCVPRSQCYIGEAQNLNYERIVFMTLDWPDDPMQYTIVDIGVGVYGEEFVTLDTVRITYYTLTGIKSYDFSSQYKARVMSNVSYPEYAQGLFCRYNDTLFFLPPRLNGWTAQNLAGVNSTLCALLGIAGEDRVMVNRSEIYFGLETYLSATVEAFGQIRANGSFVGCVYATKTITPIVPASVVGLPVGVIVAIVMGSAAGVALLFLIVTLVRRRPKKKEKAGE